MGRVRARAAIAVAFAFAAVALPTGSSAAAGDLDPTFGNGGVVVSDFGTGVYATGEALTLQSDGKLIVVGTSSPRPPSNFDVAIARYNTDGSLDAAFGSGGRVASDFGTPNDQALSAAVQPDGRIVVAGFAHPANAGEEMLVARYTSTGALDTTFGSGGAVTIADDGFWDEADDMTLQPDGKIVLVGWQVPGNSFTTTGPSNFLVVRLNVDGSLDSTFASGGRAVVDFGADDAGVGAAVAPDGGIVAVGVSATSNGSDFAIARLDANGALDLAFGTGGIVTVDVGGYASAYRVAIGSDGTILASGSADSGAALVRLNADGSPDSGFGSSGVVVTGGFRLAYQAQFLPDGKIVAGGYGGSSPSQFAVARFLPDGTLDPTFGSGGVVTTAVTPSGSNAFGVEVQSDGKVVLGGEASQQDQFGGYNTFALARYLAASATPTIHVSGNGIVDAQGAPLLLHGVNRSGSEYMCVQGRGIFDGPVDANAVSAIAGWGANAVRIPLNEDCWLGINGVAAPYAGASYQQAIAGFVQTLEAAGLTPILELHWSAPGTTPATGQSPMPDRDHSVDFWRSVATAFAGDGKVVFDLFNEPYPDNNTDTVAAWACWRDGGSCSGVPYAAAGMQELVDAVRAAGARNLILLGGPTYANALDRWSAYEPVDPLSNLAASWHVYPYNGCNTVACWDATAAPLAAQTPIVATEIGSQSIGGVCDRDAPVAIMLWLDQHTTGYLGWTWDAWGDCNSLIADYGGTPSPRYGRAYHDHLAGIPQPPTHVVAAAGAGAAAVSWVAPTDSASVPITSYTVTSSPDGVTATVSGSRTSATVAPLRNGIPYTFTVTAANPNGGGAASDASSPITPSATDPVPAAASGVASPTSATTLTTSADPASTGGTSTSITVPAGTAGGSVSLVQTGTSGPSPSGYTFGNVQIEISAPAATATNPLQVVFTTAPPPSAPLDAATLAAAQLYRSEGGGPPALVPGCTTAGQALADGSPCVSVRQYVSINSQTYIQLVVLTARASRWNSARPVSGAVTVSDKAYAPQNLVVQPGAALTWTFTGAKSHTATESVGLGGSGTPLFDSGLKSSGSYRFVFDAAGSYAYKSTPKNDSLTGTIQVPVVASPSAGTAASLFSIMWSTRPLSGYVFTVQYRFRPAGATGWKSWTTWKSSVASTSAMFAPTQGAGTYAFHALIRNTATGHSSGYSPDVTITVS